MGATKNAAEKITQPETMGTEMEETEIKEPETEQAETEGTETLEIEEAETEELHQSAAHTREFDSDESYLLTKIAMAEAEGEDTEGKALVMLVVLNRAASDEFPDTIEEVIYQKGQFSPIANGRYDRVEPDQDCLDALALVESGWDESDGALYFESKSSSDWHRKNLHFLFQHGRHFFYTDKEDQE
jgi:N-acetylmuramoyl-L-alanine amidase